MDLLDFALKNKNDIAIFKDNAEFYQYILLRILNDADEPIGSWAIQDELNHHGIKISSPTIGRYLRLLDNQNYTVKVSNKGRILEGTGKKALAQYDEYMTNEMFQSSMRKATKITNVQKLIEVYIVRKAIETEAVKLCVEHMTQEQLKRLYASALEYKNTAIRGESFLEPSLIFHSIIGEGSGNVVLSAIIDLLLNSQKNLEKEMDELITRAPDRGLLQSEEHWDIAQAISKKDAEQAALLMEDHMQKLIDALSQS